MVDMKLQRPGIINAIYKDSLIINSIYLIATNFFGLILGFFFWMIATRNYSPNDIGMMSTILSSVYLISMISLVGLPMALMFYLPRNADKANRIINSCLIIVIMISIILSLIFILGLDIFAPKLKVVINNFEMTIIFILSTVATTVSLLLSGAYTAGKKSSYNMIKENAFGLTKIFPLIILTGFGAIGILISWIIGLVVALILGFILLYKLWKYTPIISIDPIIKDMASFSIGNYIAGILYVLPKYIFPIIIVNFISFEAAGYFFIAMTVAGLLHGIPYSISSSFLAESSDENKFWDNVIKALRFNVMLLIPGTLLFIIFGKFVLNVFNPNYAENSFISLIILAMTSIPLSIVTIFSIIRNAQKRLITVSKINGTLSIMTLLLSIPLMKIWNIEGVAISYLIANSIMCTVIIFKMKNPIESTRKLMKYKKKSISPIFE